MSRVPRRALVGAVVKVRAVEFDAPGIEVEDYYLHGTQEEKPPRPKAKANDARRTAHCCQDHPLGGPIQGEDFVAGYANWFSVDRVLSRYSAGRLRSRRAIEVQHPTESLTPLYPCPCHRQRGSGLE